MKHLGRWDVAARAASQWRLRYENTQYWDRSYRQDGLSAADVYDRLVALGPRPNPSEVDEIIGNSSWTRLPRCYECGSRVDEVLVVNSDSDDHWSVICPTCLLRGLMLLEPK